MDTSMDNTENREITSRPVTDMETEMTETETAEILENSAIPESTDAMETPEAAVSTETATDSETAATSESTDAMETPEAAETKETAEACETAEPTVTAEAGETAEPTVTATPEEIMELTESVTPSSFQEVKTNGNWGTVIVIILLIVSAGAALAVILLRRKNREDRKSLYQYEANQNAATIVNQELPSSAVSCGMAQTIGKREQQQDSLYCSNWKDPGALLTRGLLAAVADGIGGLKDGNLASQNAMQAVRSTFLEGSPGEPPPDRLLSCAAAAQKSVLKLNETSSCGATLVSVLITGRTMHFLSIGDSRIYLYRAGALLQLNREHILRRENEEKETFFGAGETLTRKRAGALTSYLGKSNLTQIDRSLQPMKLLPGDRIALMSDGVFNTLSEQEIIVHLRKNPEAAAREMIQDVDIHDHPSQDNATVVVIGID